MTLDQQPAAFPPKRRKPKQKSKEMPIKVTLTIDPKTKKVMTVQCHDGDFKTSHRVLLRVFSHNGIREYELVIDETSMSLNVKQYVFLYILMKQMFIDARNPRHQTSTMGFLGTTTLCSHASNPHLCGSATGSSTLYSGEIPKLVHRLRNKFEELGFSRDLVETRTRQYRISTKPSNVQLRPL